MITDPRAKQTKHELFNIVLASFNLDAGSDINNT